MNKTKIFLSAVLVLAAVSAGTLLFYRLKPYSSYVVPQLNAANNNMMNGNSMMSGSYGMSAVMTHNSAASCWTAINGSVYDLTSWIDQHPGGPEAILFLCGKDGSSAFNDQHGGQRRPANELAGFKIGTLSVN